jgi:hypothetical protein
MATTTAKARVREREMARARARARARTTATTAITVSHSFSRRLNQLFRPADSRVEPVELVQLVASKVFSAASLVVPELVLELELELLEPLLVLANRRLVESQAST